MDAELNERTRVVKSGAIVAFPLAARAREIDRCARELDRIHGSAAVDYWKAECRKLAQQLSALGLLEDEVRHEIMEFQTEVQIAIACRYQPQSIAKGRSESLT
ncbi:DUF6074 family protein [Sinorhizobium numidicum]|uniref:DUF6074 family protein n=1 Tax=Sinorhizobium numidicum TaxID=680248 RepID=A0ABY8CPX6_9HYPH|nr:DUF6074 family protein [Sinorhizobium numidicum]WEX74227.1 DUF6074 family protein [Sinorhizobium numidicum]WEX80212.1 DUF6074 family protein [Sinorhizobium numidicum]